MTQVKTIDLVAYGNRKRDLIEWVEWNYKMLINHQLVCTGTTGRLVERAIRLTLTTSPGASLCPEKERERRLNSTLSVLMGGKRLFQLTRQELG